MLALRSAGDEAPAMNRIIIVKHRDAKKRGSALLAMPSTRWKFAGYEFSAARGLERGGVAVAIQAKPLALLALLLRAQGGIVSKDAIAAAIWGDETPSDASIARAVVGVRKAIDSGGVDCVRTIYGVGVQMTCAIETAGGNPADDRQSVTSLLNTAWEVNSARTPESYARAVEILRYTVKRFPDSASAWALLADTYASEAVRIVIAPAKAAAQISHCCKMALRADPYCGQAMAVSGWSMGLLSGNSEAGLSRVEASINKQSDWPTFLYKAWLHIDLHDLAGAIDALDKGLLISPLNRSLLGMYAEVLLYQEKFEEADAWAKAAQQVRDDVDLLWIVRSIVALERGDVGRGCIYAERAAALALRDRQTLIHLAYAYARAGQADRARKTLAEIETSGDGYTPTLLAAPYLALGEIAEAARIIKIAEAEGCPYRAMVWCDPRLKPLWSRL